MSDLPSREQFKSGLNENHYKDSPYWSAEDARREFEKWGYSQEDIERRADLGFHAVKVLKIITESDQPLRYNLVLDQLHIQDYIDLEDLHAISRGLGFIEGTMLSEMRPGVVEALAKTGDSKPPELWAYHRRLQHKLKNQTEGDPYPYKVQIGAALNEATLFRDAGRLDLYVQALKKMLAGNEGDMIGDRIEKEIKVAEDQLSSSQANS